MKEIDFKGYLEKQHGDQYHGAPEDKVNCFDEWIDSLDIDSICKMANAYTSDKVREIIDENIARLRRAING